MSDKPAGRPYDRYGNLKHLIDPTTGQIAARCMRDFGREKEEQRSGTARTCMAPGCYKVLTNKHSRFCIQHKRQYIVVKERIERFLEYARKKKEEERCR